MRRATMANIMMNGKKEDPGDLKTPMEHGDDSTKKRRGTLAQHPFNEKGAEILMDGEQSKEQDEDVDSNKRKQYGIDTPEVSRKGTTRHPYSSQIVDLDVQKIEIQDDTSKD